MRGMKTTKQYGSVRKSGTTGAPITVRQIELLQILRQFAGEFTLLDVAAKTGRPVQAFGVTVRALVRMGYIKQTFRSPSGREPNRYRRVT